MIGDYGDGTYRLDRAFQRKTSPPPVEFQALWPSETRGDGSVVKNNRRDGSAQGKGTLIKKAHCRQCGFPNDLVAIDHSGGSLDGNGGAYVASTGVATTTLLSGVTHTENYGDPGVKRNSGCAMCGSKNSTSRRVMTFSDPWAKTRPLGF